MAYKYTSGKSGALTPFLPSLVVAKYCNDKNNKQNNNGNYEECEDTRRKTADMTLFVPRKDSSFSRSLRHFHYDYFAATLFKAV